jgi:hypothetical protein
MHDSTQSPPHSPTHSTTHSNTHTLTHSLTHSPPPQFLFTDADFEHPSFHAASFVAKYRRATSLDSLRSQLHSYTHSLKHQLYTIINQDYQDFIAIATKLEGVDQRVEHLRKPLLELRMDLTLLHDTIVSNIHAISGKIEQRREVSMKKQLLESSLACMKQLSNVEDVLNMKDSSVSSLPHTLTRRELMLKASSVSVSVMSESSGNPEVTELHQCSELERASMALAEAIQHLQEEKKSQSDHSDSDSNSNSKKSSVHSPSMVAMRRSLELRAQSIQSALLSRLKLCCKVILSSNSTAPVTGEGSSSMSVCRRRSLGHLLRALVAVGSGSVMEDLVAETVTLPALKNILTQGRVDGSKGRGSYSGLKDCLTQIVNTGCVHLRDVMVLSEELFARQYQASLTPPMDLVVNGVWVPVLNTLKKTHGGIFSSGIANVFHECYIATHEFVRDICSICGPDHVASISSRLESHKSYSEFKSLWKMDLHYQVRVS